LHLRPLRIPKNIVSDGGIDVCQRQRPSREQAEGSRRAWRAFPCAGNPERVQYNKGTEIYGEAEPADYIYQVADGSVRSYKLLSDGRRQIGAFHLVGDIFGLENGPVHRFTAEAIFDTTVRLMKRCSLENVAERDAFVTLDLLNMTTSNLQHAEDHMLLLGRKTSLERVAAFLLEMDRRLTATGVLALPMSRRDIADYLGLTLETVSRALSYLHGKGILGFLGQTQRQIVLLDRARLAELDL
jgi:CRP/FNR family transcriptional regulator, nitrogen fixation regulation protein